MKKILLLLFCLYGVFVLNATEYTYVMSDYGKPAFTTSDGNFQTLGKKADGVTGPSYNGGEKSLDVRLYAKNTYTITSLKGVKITRIDFVISRTGKYNLTSLESTVGLCKVVGAPDFTASWTGETTEVTFTIGEKAIYGYDGETAAGQLDFTQLKITTDDASAIKTVKSSALNLFANNGVLTVTGFEDGTMIDIFDLTGSHRLSAPLNNGQIAIEQLNRGLYVVKIGNKVAKIMVN